VEPLTVAGVAVVAVVSITTHEASHGFVADRLGDPTARERGRLTLNPIPHIDLFFTILLPLFMILSGTGVIFGGAKPVPVDVSRLRHPRRDWALVGAAGPVSNLLIAVLLAALLSFGAHAGVLTAGSGATDVLAVGIFLNVLLAIFNLIPIPPLDGSRVLQYALSGETLRAYRQFERWGLIVLVVLVVFVRPAQIFLVEAVFLGTEAITRLFGIWPDVEPLLRRVLFG
jgi:Zn-dependent protease